MLSACLTDTFSKHFTHSLSFNECAVVNNKVVSTRKEGCSAHADISKMDVQDEGGQERTAPKPAQSCHEVNTCLCLLLQAGKPGFPTLQSPVFSKSLSSSFLFLGGLLFLVSGLNSLVFWFCMTPAVMTREEVRCQR